MIKETLRGILLTAGMMTAAISASGNNLTEKVNVFIGTGGHGHTFPGAIVPHGMVGLSPDTRLVGWDACSGYHHSDSTIMGFSHTHLSGTGIGDYGDILFMPVVGEKSLITSVDDNHGPDYRSRFSHETESGRPGYYEVLLLDDNIHAELTATPRSGFHRYAYPEGSDKRLIVDMTPTLHGHRHPLTEIKIINDSTIAGFKYTQGWARHHYVYFYAVFSQPFKYQLYDGDKKTEGQLIAAPDAKAVLSFTGDAPMVMAKVGISGVDVEGARKNLTTEIPGWNFDEIAKAADRAWEKELGRIEIETSDKDAETVFYTSLYHAIVQPGIASDVDGRYRTMNHEIEQSDDYTNYTVFSLWDTFRALHPLYTIITPTLNQSFIRTFLKKYDESGILPKWELSDNETGTMIGYHAVSVIGDAMSKGQTDFDLEKALKASLRSSVWDTTNISPMVDRGIIRNGLMPIGIKYKNEIGYVPSDKQSSSVSCGMEYAYNDWLISQMASWLGYDEIAARYAELGKNYRNYYDPETKTMRGRKLDGSPITPYDPQSVKRPSCYTEGNAWQWSWFAPQDVEGLQELMGGKDAFEANLDKFFTLEGLTGDSSAAADVTGLIGQYAHGNEPSHHIPYLYNFTSNPWKTNALINYIMHNFYRNDPDGLCGNEDVGQMSAWYVLNAMGFYSFCPGKPEYQLSFPIMDKVTIHLENGNDFVINKKNGKKGAYKVDRVTLDGKEIAGHSFPHSALAKGGELTFHMAR